MKELFSTGKSNGIIQNINKGNETYHHIVVVQKKKAFDEMQISIHDFKILTCKASRETSLQDKEF